MKRNNVKTKGKDQMLIGKTYNLWRDGKTAEEISVDINQPIDNVNACIEICKDSEEKRKLVKSKYCGGCVHDVNKDTCDCKRECVRDENGYYTEYFRTNKRISDIFNSMSDTRRSVIYSIICNDERLSDAEFIEKYKDYI